MVPTLEDALARIAELENRVARLERLVIGSSELGLKPHAPANPSLSTDMAASSGQPLRSNEAPLPELDSGLVETFLSQGLAPSGKPGKLDVKSAIEASFPNILEKITLIWGHPECETYLNNLMIDDRGNRQGFDLEVMGELMLLTSISQGSAPDMWTNFMNIGDRR